MGWERVSEKATGGIGVTSRRIARHIASLTSPPELPPPFPISRAFQYEGSQAQYEARSINYVGRGAYGKFARVAFWAVIAIHAVILVIKGDMMTLLELL